MRHLLLLAISNYIPAKIIRKYKQIRAIITSEILLKVCSIYAQNAATRSYKTITTELTCKTTINNNLE